jgi:isopenicillin N synthase-like dioxygenase
MLIYQPPKVSETIPVIDLGATFAASHADRKATAWQIHKAAREAGFFYITNHGVPAETIENAFAHSARFFALPERDKLQLDMKQSRSTAGYEPVGGQRLDSQKKDEAMAPPDLKESFYCGMELPPDHPWSRKQLRAFGHNQWPAAMPEFKDFMTGYWNSMRSVADHLLSLLALSLELPDNWFEPHFDMPGGTLRLIKYPPQPQNAQFNQIGAGAHTDWGGITLLAQDDVGGLEVRNADGEWIKAAPIPDTLVVNLGDLMARWTNGVYNSNMHRVNNNQSGRDRYSIVFFYTARPDAIIEPMPGCVSAEKARKFATCTAYEHTQEMFRRSYGFDPAGAALLK